MGLTMFAIVFLACTGDQCELSTIPVEPKTKYGCMVVAQFVLADWASARKDVTIKGYTCVPWRKLRS